MVQKTKKVCIGTRQAHAKSQCNWTKFQILIFDPCFKKHTSNFFGHIHCQYKIGIVPKFGAPQINIGAITAWNPRGVSIRHTPVQSRVNEGVQNLFILTLVVLNVWNPKGVPKKFEVCFLKQGSKMKISNLVRLRRNFAWVCRVPIQTFFVFWTRWI